MKRAFVALFCLVFLISGCVLKQDSMQKQSLSSEVAEYYEDIPGITAEEIAAVEKLRQTVGSFSYGHVNTTEAFKQHDGSYTGFTYEFCDLLAGLFGMSFFPEPYEAWDSLVNDFNGRQIAFMGDFTPTPERKQSYYMTAAIAERLLRLYTLEGSDNIETETDIEGLRIGFLTGTITADEIKAAYPVSFEDIDLADYDMAADKLKTGEIDAFVMESIADPAFEEYTFIQSREFFPLVYSYVSLATSNPDLEPIITVVDKYLVSGGAQKLYELHKENDYEYIKYKLNNSFTNEEKAYIYNMMRRRRSVPVAMESYNYPISFYNETDSEFQGIAIDVLAEITKLTGLRFDSAVEMNTPWAEIIEKLKTGELSMVTELLYSDMRAESYAWADIPFISTNFVLISKTEHPDISPQQVVQYTVGAMSDSYYEYQYRTWFPFNDNLVTYPTQNEAFDALENGEIDLLMATELMLYTQTNYRERPWYKVNIFFNSSIDSCYGFNKNEETLRSIINKTMSFIDIDAVCRSWTNKTFDYSAKMANMRADFMQMFSALLFLILVVLLFLFLRTKRLSKDLERQTEEAQIASMAKSTFLARMSHEIRTPLNAIIGMSTAAKKHADDTEKVLFSVNQIISSSNYLLNILNDVLDMSKIESGKLEIMNEPFRLLEAYSEVSGIITQRCLEKNIRFITNIDEMEDMTLIGDKLRVNQVLLNILSNAVKFTGNSGEIKFVATPLWENDEEVLFEFSVSDNGIGIEEKQLEKLFAPFEQANSSIAAKYGGTGLGLSISQNLVNMMGGKIEVESKQGEGSKFHFSLLFSKGQMRGETPPDTVEFDFSGKRVLLVEDVYINRVVICELLDSTGLEIHEAENGIRALEVFSASRDGYYDIILMDILMPELNGYETTTRIRALEKEDAKTIPIIAMTANVYKEDIDKALAIGMNGHIPKPIDANVLLKVLADFLINNKGLN